MVTATIKWDRGTQPLPGKQKVFMNYNTISYSRESFLARKQWMWVLKDKYTSKKKEKKTLIQKGSIF